MSSIKPTHFYADFQSLAALKKDAKTQEPDALKEAAKQFESLFTRMMLKNMRAASLGESMFDSQQTQFYQDMFDDQLAVHLSQGKGMGLADMLVKQLRQGGAPVQPADRPTGQPASERSPAQAASGGEAVGERYGLRNKVDEQIDRPIEDDSLGHAAHFGRMDLESLARRKGANTPIADFGLAAMRQRDSSTIAAASADNANARSSDPSPVTCHPSTAPAPAHTTIANSPAEFIQRMLPHAQKAARELGVDPHALVAQAALETGWGKSVPCASDGTCSYNMFGIKATSTWNGGSVGARTLEFESGIPVATRARFRSYASPEESFRDYAALISKSDRYTNARNTGNNVHAFANALQAGGYATDPQYARKLSAVTQTVRNLAGEAGGFKLAESLPLNGSEGVRG